VNHISLNAIKKTGRRIPFITVGMDPVELHRSWISKDTDIMIVATEEAKAICLREGLPEEKIRLLGIPIDPRFTLTHDKKKAKSALGLEEEVFTVLVMGGGEGSGNIHEIVKELNAGSLKMQLIVICGRNESLKKKLEDSKLRFRSKIIGFSSEVPAIMDASDMIITKGGPGAIFEALAKELPMIINSWLPGQEEGNIRFVLKHGIGKVETDPKRVTNAIQELLNDKNIMNNIRSLKKPRAVFDIADLILDQIK
jgi:1,2-diacylglycerol 3-beta-galactosyltransferase